MLPVIENLLILQDRDRKIMRAEAELNNIGPERASLDEKAKRVQAELEGAKHQANQIESDRKRLELDVEAKKTQIEKYSLQQFQTKKNEEYRALGNEIDNCRAAISRIEDEMLELMEKADAAAAQVKAASATATAALKDIEVAKSMVADKEIRLRKELETLKADYSQLEEAVEEGVREKYVRLRKQKGGTTVVGIERGICGGCHMKLPMQIVLSCQSQQEIVQCPNCARILYFTREMDLATA